MTVQFPHCDPYVLHAPGQCRYCDKYPAWQAARRTLRISFTGQGESDNLACPSTLRRPIEDIEAWGGNRPKPEERMTVTGTNKPLRIIKITDTKAPKMFLVSKKQIAGAVAHWAVRLSPYSVPHGLEVVIASLNDTLSPLFEQNSLGYGAFSYEGLKKMVYTHLMAIPEARDWSERRNGSKFPLKFIGRFIPDGDPDDDFIDMHALARNVANTLVREPSERPIPDILGE